MTTPFIWITEAQAKQLHDSVIEGFGGSEGLRDEGLLKSALANPQNLFHYEDASLFDCAAGYAQSISQNHAFIDGNKRTGFMVAIVFLSINGFKIVTQDDKNHEDMMVDLAEKKVTREAFSGYLKKHARPSSEN